jgi:hypothetical protein
VLVGDGLLDGVEGDEGAVLEVVREGERLDVLLQAGRDVALVAPEAAVGELVANGGEHRADLV